MMPMPTEMPKATGRLQMAICGTMLGLGAAEVGVVKSVSMGIDMALFYPAGYVEGEAYPMIVYIYELRSQNLHGYTAPSERSPYNTSVFTQNGYFVFQPDIVYRPQNPGLSAVECVVPAVEK